MMGDDGFRIYVFKAVGMFPVSLDADADIQWWKQRFRKTPKDN